MSVICQETGVASSSENEADISDCVLAILYDNTLADPQLWV